VVRDRRPGSVAAARRRLVCRRTDRTGTDRGLL